MNNSIYDIDHIYPRHFTKDDSIHNNLVLVKRQLNADKSDMPITKEIQTKMHGRWKALLAGGFISSEKYARLTRNSYTFSDEEKAGFINRQLVETSQATKAVTRIFSQAFEKDTKIVFSKARLVSDFRQKFELPKSRVLNCYHHANDAYLNIVVGNSYYVKFEGNPARFIKESKGKEEEKKYKYHLSKFFENTVQNKNEVAWSVEEGNNTITTVKRTMAKYSPLVTYKTEEGKGGYFDETIYPKSKSKDIGYIGLKTKNSPLSNVKRYGGKTSIAKSGYCFVKYIEKNKLIKTFEPIPIYLGESKNLTTDILNQYLENLYIKKEQYDAAYTFEVVIGYIPPKTEIIIDGYRYVIGGSFGDQLYIDGSMQIKTPKEYVMYLHKLEKANNKKDYTEVDETGNLVITSERNVDLLEYLIKKFKEKPFCNKINSINSELKNGIERFSKLDVSNQTTILLDVIDNIYGRKREVNLLHIGGKASVGKTSFNKKISQRKEAIIVMSSYTGIYTREVDLLNI